MGRRSRSFANGEGFALLFVVLILSSLSAFLGPIFFSDRFVSRRSRSVLFSSIARQNARFAIQMALDDLSEQTGDCRCATATAAILSSGTVPESELWTGVWRLDEAGHRKFSKWLVAGSGTTEETLPSSIPAQSVAILADYGHRLRCPTVAIQSPLQIGGRYGYWVGDESVKARINLPPPEVPLPSVAQRLGPSAPDLVRAMMPLRGFHQLQRLDPSVGGDRFSSVTLASAGLLICSRTGEFLDDLGVKLDRHQFDRLDYIFPPDPDLPQPPPTFALVASYFDEVAPPDEATSVSARAIWPPYRLQRPTSYSDDATLATLEASESVPGRYGMYPVIFGFQFAFIADFHRSRLGFRPAVMLWNPNAVTILPQTYRFRWYAADGKTRNLAGRLALPALEVVAEGKTVAIPLGGDDGIIFDGTISTDFRPGEVKTFQLEFDDQWTFGQRRHSLVEGSQSGAALFLDLPRDVRQIRRLNSPADHLHWANMSCDLRDASGRTIQEIFDFSDDDQSVSYDVPQKSGPGGAGQAGQGDDAARLPDRAFLFALSAQMKTAIGEGRNIRWLATYNPRAQQVGRSFYENRPIFGEPEEIFDRHFSSYHVEFSEMDRPVMAHFFQNDGPNRACLFDCPRRLTSLGLLQHLNLAPFSYHPAYAVGNSWASPLIPIHEVRHLRRPNFLPNSANSALRREALLDYSFLLNGRLFDEFFVSGLEWNRSAGRWRTFTNCQILDEADRASLEDSKTVARNVMNIGAFNVNSVSVDAWETLLMGADHDPNGTVYYLSRFTSSADLGCKMLSPSAIHRLAVCIVDEVRRCGPFLSLSQFINRNPEADNETNLKGPLQRAIDRSGVNDGVAGERIREDRRRDWFNERAGSGGINDGGPYYLTSADFLQTYGNFLTARGDTFLIRGYGDCHRGRTGRILASAVGEMMVQRLPDRSFRIVYFRWVK